MRSRRYAILRDLDHPDFAPLAVLFETDRGGARLEVFEDAPPDASKLRREFDSFDDALELWSPRNALCSAIGREGESAG